MKETEGVIKYELDYRPTPLPPGADLPGLLRWFRVCREVGLIGRDPARYDGYAYGNISVRAADGFVISGTQTGGEEYLTAELLAWVQDFDITENRLRAAGPAPPSSEAMSHGQVYRAIPAVGAVIHVHSPQLWHAAVALTLPTTPPSIAYGTPAMATAVDRILHADPEQTAGLFAMGGHEDGIVAYGPNIDSAGAQLLDALRRSETLPG